MQVRGAADGGRHAASGVAAGASASVHPSQAAAITAHFRFTTLVTSTPLLWSTAWAFTALGSFLPKIQLAMVMG